MTCAVWSGVHGITSLRIAMPSFPWPPIDEQVALLADPWRAALGPAALCPQDCLTGERDLGPGWSR